MGLDPVPPAVTGLLDHDPPDEWIGRTLIPSIAEGTAAA